MAEINPGDVLKNRYLVIERVSGPDSPTVSWRGQDTVLGRDVHLEQISSGDVALAIDGARRASLVSDERLIRIIDISDQENVLIRPWLEAVDLATVLRLGPLDPATARTITGELATALRSARRRGLHHLALRPEAVMLSANNQVFLSGLSVDSWVFGYDDGDAFSASRKDAVDLVALLYAMLSGQWPQDRTRSRLDPAAAGEFGPLSLSEVRPDTPADLVTLCDVTLGKQGDGPITPDDLVQELRPWDELEIDLGDFLGGADETPVAVAPVSRPTPIRLGKPFAPVGPVSAAAGSAQSASSAEAAASASSASDPQDSEPAGPTAAAQAAAQARTIGAAVLAAVVTGLTALGTAVIAGSQKLWAWLQSTAAKVREGVAQRQAARAQAQAAAQEQAAAQAAAAAAAQPASVPNAAAAAPVVADRSAQDVVGQKTRSEVAEEATSVLALPSADAKPKPRELVRLQHIITATVILLFVVGVFIGVQHAMEIIRTGGEPGVPSRPTDMPSPSPLPTRPPSPSPSPEPSPSPSPTITYPAPVIANVSLVDTTDPDRDSPQWLPRAWDGDLNTTWNSWWSGSENWNGSRIGMGLLIEFAEETQLTEINLIMTALGGHVQLRSVAELGALPPAGEVLAESEGTGRTTLRPADPIITDRVVLWFDRLPLSADGTYRVELAEIQLF